MAVAAIGGRAAVGMERGAAAAKRAAVRRPNRNAKTSSRKPSIAPENEVAVACVVAAPAFHERSLVLEGNAAAFRIDAGSGWATGALPAGAGENEIAKFLSDAVSLAKQMQTAMGRSGNQPTGGSDSEPGAAAEVQILVAHPHPAGSRQSAIRVSVQPSGNATVTLQPGSDAGHLVAMLQHFLMALNLAPRDESRVPGAGR